MLKTERMRKVVVAGAKPHLRATIETLHSLQALHIEEHDPTKDFGLGSPLPEGEPVAEALLKARGLEKSLGIDVRRSTATMASLDAAMAKVRELETQAAGLLDERTERSDTVKRLESEVARLRRLSALGLRLEHLYGYQTLDVHVGTASTDPRPALAARTDRFECVVGGTGSNLVVAVFAPRDAAPHVDAVLAESGFHALEVPAGEGPIDTVVGQRATEARQAASRIEAIDAELERFRSAHGNELVAAIETLTRASEKASAPLTFATAANSFVVSGYVAANQTKQVERALQAACDQRLFIEWTEPVIASHHHEEHVHTHTEGQPHEEHLPEHGDDPPAKFAHKNQGVNSFTMLLGMHSLPKYKEIDPTFLMWITFPIFFGLMIGDAAYGILVMGVAAFFKRHYLLGIGGPKVSRMLMLSGVWTLILGTFMFGEAFGIHFVDEPGTISWEWLLHADWHEFYASAQHTVVSAAESTAGGEAAAGGEEHHAPHLMLFGLQLGFFSKLHDVVMLLIISVIVAAVHLNLAILIGVRNMWVMHGAKHAILGRVSWLILQLGIGMVAWGALHPGSVVAGLATDTVGWLVFVVSVIMLIGGEGAIAILELPKIFSNALSYTRLTAVGLSKAGMLLAVNTFAFTEVSSTSFVLAGVGGFILAVVGYLVVLALGILAGGLHSMRLQFVEFFGWFYEGGGRPFKAFGDPAQRR